MTIVIAGGSGMIGSALASHLRSTGAAVRLLVRRTPAGADEVRWDPAAAYLPPEALTGARAVVNLAGAPVSQRWTARGRRDILTSRVDATSTLARAIAELPGNAPRPALIQGSAIGYYGGRGEEILTEQSGPGRGFLAQVVRAWEHAAQPARDAGAAVTCARTGIVLSARGGALARLLPLIRLGLGGPLGPGTQWWSWISLRDEVRALAHLIDSPIEGPVNLVAPGAARCADVVRALAAAAHRPAVIAVPGPALRVVAGGFAGEILASQHVLPTALTNAGFRFHDQSISDAAPALVSR